MSSRVERWAGVLAGSNHRLSRTYVAAAWTFGAAAIVLWLPFVTAALGFYLGAIVLRREGL